ncbi:unnamed protein product, partial [Candidula unifasciata]
RRCDVPADVVFLMDASDSIKPTEWEQEKDFVSVLIDNLEVDRYAIHVGVIVYSTELGQVIDLQPFKTKSQLKGLLQQAEQINQGTDTAKAISKMIEMSENQGRIEAGAKQIGVIITDGRSTDVSATIREARRARLDRHMTMIALGVGNETFLEELVEITGHENTNRLFQVKDFAQLRDVVAQLQELICEIIPATTTKKSITSASTTTVVPTTSPVIPPFPCSMPADLVFLIDGSYSISPPDWVKGKQFVSYLINSIDVGVDSIHVGIVVYGSDIGDVVPLQPFKDKNQLKSAATGLIQPPVGRTNTALGLQKVREMFNTHGRLQVPHIVIVITDGMSSNPSETRDQAIMAKREGITIFVVGVGDRVLRQEVEEMASSPQSLFDAPDFKFLVGMVQLLRDNICSAIQVTSIAATWSTTPVATTTRPPVPELCKQCLVEGGVGFNPLPTDCEKYVMCLPQGASYEPQIKSCPFGMFWSNVAVSCLDARYVDCPADKCKALPDSATYPSVDSSCRSYYSCSNQRSTPLCCEQGYKYVVGIGCLPDPSCLDPCPLNVTIYNQACSPAINLTFEGIFPQLHQTIIHRVIRTDSGSAYFNGDSSLTFPGTIGQDMGDNLLIKFKYRKQRNTTSGEVWNNNNGEWGFQHWFTNTSHNGSTQQTVIVGKSEVARPDIINPRGAAQEPLEVITISRNGTIILDPRYDVKVNATWPAVNQSMVDTIQFSNLGSLSTPTIMNGIVYVPVGFKKVLVHDHSGGGSNLAVPTWKIVSINADGQTGKVEEFGRGAVPVSIQEKYGFDLRSPVTERWFVLAPGGVVLQNGEGAVPYDVINRYAGFTQGTLVKVFERGDSLERWQISKPDGSQLQSGNGDMPQSLVDVHKLDKILVPQQTSTTWSLLASDGTILESGTGNVPDHLVDKYSRNPSVTVLKSSSHSGREPNWEISRPSGVKIMEGRGLLPQGITRFIRGELPLPQISKINKWTVTMPDGTVRNGTGQIPQEILDLFLQMTSTAGKIHHPKSHLKKTWTVNLPDGTVKTGEGEIPEDIRALMNSQGTNFDKKWQITLPDGTVKSGVGDVPPDLLAMISAKRSRRAARTASQSMDIISNCGSASGPSLSVSATDSDITLTLITSQAPSRPVALSLPTTDGLNDVMFTYDGSQVTGYVNGYVRKLPLSGNIETRPSPVVIGQCMSSPETRFVGEIDELQIYFCLP